MTTDEKAKAYEMALEAARKELGVDRKEWEVVQQVLHNIFPELRESEDERIRKKLIETIGYFRSRGIDQQLCEEFLTYLEKQKEQKPADYDHEMWKNCEANFEGGKKEVIDHPGKYGLQKVPKPAWSEEDEYMLNRIIEILSLPPVYDTKACEKMVSWLKSLRPSWKPSKEHLSALLAVFNDPNNIGSQTCQLALTDLYEQLKKL